MCRVGVFLAACLLARSKDRLVAVSPSESGLDKSTTGVVDPDESKTDDPRS